MCSSDLASKKHLKGLNLGKKLPKMSDLKSEYDALFIEKKKVYSRYHNSKKEMQELAIAKQNIEQILEMDTSKKEKRKSSLLR